MNKYVYINKIENVKVFEVEASSILEADLKYKEVMKVDIVKQPFVHVSCDSWGKGNKI